MTLSAEQQTAHEQSHVRTAWFVEFHFKSGLVHLSTLGINHTWGGFEWMGVGTISDVTPLDEVQGVASDSITFTMALPQTEWLALAVGPVEEYRGQLAKMYECPLDDNFRLIGTPQRCWAGTMDTMSANVSGKAPHIVGSVALKCETSAYGFRRSSGLRLSAAQHKLKYPNDTGLDRMTRLASNQFPWLSRRFQQI